MRTVQEDDKVMPQEGELMQAYRHLEAQASRLSDLAQDENWQSLAGEQASYTDNVGRIADLEQHTGLDTSER
jgi:hypothetical protein